MDEFSVRLAPRLDNQKYNVFKLHKDDQITWNDSKMRRDNDFQPWQIKTGGGKISRRYKATKDGGVGDNASYFVFYKPNNNSDAYEVCPIDEWYSVSATQRYKTLTAEDAEQKFEQRHKMLNLFSVMHLKKNGETGDEGGHSQERKSFKVSEMDDWDESGDEDASDDDDDAGEDSKKKLKRKKIGKKEKDDAEDAPDEAKEESDEGDFEQREVDYMSDSSSESSNPEVEKDVADVKGIAEEDALRDLLSTDDEEDEDNPQQKGAKSSENKTGPGSHSVKQDPDGSDDSSDSDIYDVDEDKMDDVFMKKGLPSGLSQFGKQDIKREPDTTSNNISGNASNGSNTSNNTARQQPTTSGYKRKAEPDPSMAPSQPAQRPRLVAETATSPANGVERVVEDLIIKYLGRRPMSLRSLLKDIKSKLKRMQVSTINNEELIQTIAKIIKRIPHEKERINNIDYYSLKPQQ